ncbi:MAG: DUF748 domain-containing protein [Planctomycetes bacterium]|nr:DUF748 domain-containing protein [Planctomycetota bacterium]
MSATVPVPKVRRRRWRRWLLWSLLAALLGRMALPWVLPWLCNWFAGGLGLRVTWRTLSLSLTGSSLEVEDLQVAARDAATPAPPLFSARRLHADVETLALLGGELRIADVTITGARCGLERRADGTFVLPAEWTQGSSPPAEPPTPASGPLAFDLPFVIVRARIDDARISLRGPGRSEPIEAIADLLVSDLGDPERESRIEARLTSPGHLDRLQVHAAAQTGAAKVTTELRVQMRGARPAALLREWPLAGIGPDAKALDVDLHATLSAERLADDPAVANLAGEMRATVIADHAEVFGLPTLRMAIPRWSRQGAAALSMQLRDGSLHATRRADGAWVVAGMAIGGNPAAPPVAPFPLAVSGLGADLGPLNLAADAPATPFSLQLSLPGWLDGLSIRDAALRPTPLELNATVRGRGLQVQRLQPLLETAGVRCDWPTGDLTMTLRAAGTATAPTAWSASIVDLALQHGEQAIRVPEVAVAGLLAGDDGIAIDSVRLRGPELAIHRSPAGAFGIAGWEFAPVPSTMPPPSTAANGPLPRVRIRDLLWSGAAVTFTDAAKTPTTTVAIAEVALTGRDLAFGVDSSPPGAAEFSCRIPGIVERVALQARMTPHPGGGEVALTARLQQIVGQGLRPWLAPLGIEPLLQQGELQTRLSVRVEQQADGMHLRAALDDLTLRDGTTNWVRVPALTVEQARLGDARIDLGTITLRAPELHIHRRADGGLDVAGLALPATAAAARADGDAAAQPVNASPGLAWQRVSLQEGKLSLADDAPDRRRTVAASVDLSVGTLGRQRGAAATPFTLALTTGERTRIGCEGSLVADPGALRVQAMLRADGLDAAAVTPWLPPDTTWTLGQGSARGTLTAAIDRRSDGSQSIAVELRDVRIADGDTAVFGFDRAVLDAPRIAPDGNAIHLANLQLVGLRTALARENGRLRVPGLLLPAAAGGTPAAGTDPTRSTPLRLPGLQVDSIDLELAELVWTDEAAEPLRLSVRVQSTAPWHSLATDLAASPPFQLLAKAAAAPLCREVIGHVELLPFALEPRALLELQAKGIDTTALTRLWPHLQPTLQGELTDGTLTARAELELDLRRRQPDRFDFGRAFGGRCHLQHLSLIDADNRQLAGIRGVEIDARTIDPHDGTVLLRSVEIDTPALHFVHSAEAISCLGVRLLRQPTTPAVAAAAPPPPVATATRGEIAIDDLRVSGLDLTLIDTTTAPPTTLPFDALDVEVHRWSTRARTEPRPFTFSASLRGGKVELKRRTVASSMLAGFVASAAQAVAGSADRGETEARVLLEELLVQGQLQLFPAPRGRVQAAISGLELPALRGLAQSSGVEIGDGLFDGTVTTELRGRDGHEVAARLLFTHLSLSEPPGGPISTYLKLPAPIDTVLFVLRNDADEQDIPFSFHVADDGTNGVAGAAIGALGAVIADAVTRSPLRAASAVTGLLGFAGAPEDLATWRRQIVFAAGEATVPPPTAELRQLVDKLVDDDELIVVLEHVYGRNDVQRLAGRANPPTATLHALATRLRQQKGELLAQRDALAATADGQFAAGLQQPAQATLSRLHELDERLGHTEAALDGTLAQLRPGAERGADRRTRQAGRELGDLRLLGLADWLRSHLPPEARHRVEVRSPRWVVGDQPGTVILTPRRRLAH